MVRSAMGDAARFRLDGKVARVSGAVGAAVTILASPEAEWINGQLLPVNGGSLVS